MADLVGAGNQDDRACFGQSLAFLCLVPPSVKWKEEYREAMKQNPSMMKTGYLGYGKGSGKVWNNFNVESFGINATKIISIW